MKKYWPYFFLIFSIVLTGFSYWNGLNGSFLFDDTPNLEALGYQGSVRDWVTLKAYVLSGWSGPTGRPLSLLSFLINDNTWPSIPWGFKYTNLGLHLICGLLLAWVNYLILQAIQFDEFNAAWLAVAAASFWMLHPFFVSTTLYVIQRMSILSNLFILTGMLGYLKGRFWLQKLDKTKTQAYLLMSVSVSMGTLLATLSKENGALLPLLILVTEAFLQKMGSQSPRHWWLGIFLIVPSLSILGYLLWQIDFSNQPWPTRPFNQIERLYSETRIIFDYLRSLWLPRIEGAGLYQDGFIISRSLWQPISTLWGVLGLVALLTLLPTLYRHTPFIWLSITFFLCGHLIESTVVGLELYFEHRNYTPALFMFLPLAIGIYSLGQKYSETLSVIATASTLGVLSLLTWQRTQLWSNNDRLQTYWAVYSPLSARAKGYLISHLVEEKKYAEALTFANQAIIDIPESPLLTIHWLRLHINTKRATLKHFEIAAEKLVKQPFDAQAVAGLRILVDDVMSTKELTEYYLPLLHLMQALSENGPYKKFPLFMRMIAYNEARIYLGLGKPQEAYLHYQIAIDRYGQTTAAVQMLAEMASAGYFREASWMLQNIEQKITSGALDVNPMGKDYYLNELARLRILLDVTKTPSKKD